MAEKEASPPEAIKGVSNHEDSPQIRCGLLRRAGLFQPQRTPGRVMSHQQRSSVVCAAGCREGRIKTEAEESCQQEVNVLLTPLIASGGEASFSAIPLRLLSLILQIAEVGVQDQAQCPPSYKETMLSFLIVPCDPPPGLRYSPSVLPLGGVGFRVERVKVLFFPKKFL